MPDAAAVATALRDHLLAAPALVRKPGQTGALPPLFVEPRGGVPAPHDKADVGDAGATRETDSDLIVAIRLSSEVPPPPFGTFSKRYVFDLILRSSTTDALKAGRALEDAVRTRLVARPDFGFSYLLGGALMVCQASVFAGLGPVEDADGVRTELAKYLLEVLAQ